MRGADWTPLFGRDVDTLYSSSRRHAGLVQEGGSRQLLELGTRYESNLTFCPTVGKDQEKFADTVTIIMAWLISQVKTRAVVNSKVVH